jgi:tetratricopeptide (TPR) repeat protein
VSDHLDENTLFELAEGLLADEALAEIEAHLDDCGLCRAALADVARTEVDCHSSERDFATFPLIDDAHYLLGREFARGGMGRIRLARDLRLGRLVALKETILAGPEAIARFEREARITARLQHPSIVNVHEVGVRRSGERFFSMTRLEGRSLDAVVAGAHSLEARLALLPNVLAVADAMAFAHSRGIIHRDLKPKNVLVGVFGETVLIDWGLAKDLAGEGPEEALTARASADDETAAGVVVGTPAYMPPEQALGLPVDARADVYSLGAIIDHVLSGKPAYERTSALDTLEAVKKGPPLPLRERQPGVPADLLAIVERAMARQPSDRYPTAGELADDLRRYQTGQLVGAHQYSLGQLLRRWVLRHRRPLVVAAVAASVMAVGGAVAVERIIEAQRVAEAARARAETSRADAEALLSFMLNDLPTKLTPLGRLDVLDDVARKTVAYYDAQTEPADDRALGEQAVARRQLAAVLFAQGRHDAALVQDRVSLQLAQTLRARHPESDPARHEVAVAQLAVADVLLQKGDTAGALAASQAALTLEAARAEQHPLDEDAQLALGLTQRRVGEVLRWRDGAAALPHFETSLRLMKALADRHPGADAAQGQLSTALWKRGQALLAQGASKEALGDLREAVTLDEQRVANDPGNTLSQRDLSVSEEMLADALRTTGEVGGAMVHYRAALARRQVLVNHDETNVQLELELSRAQNKLGDLLTAQGDAAAALLEYRAARTAQARRGKTDLVTLHSLSSSDIWIGNALLTMKDSTGALASYRSALELGRAAVEGERSNIEWQRDLSIAHNKLGSLLLAQGEPAPALEQYLAAQAIRAELERQDPSNTERLRDSAFSHEMVGDALVATGDMPGALLEYRAELDTVTALLERDPRNTDRQSDVADAHEKRGDALAQSGDRVAALNEYTTALSMREALAAQEPQNQERRELAEAIAKKVRHLAPK